MAFPGSSMPFKAPTKDDPVTETSREFCDDGHVVDFSTVYDIGEKLGSGTFGNVHRCTHRITGKQHAVKTIILTSLTPHQKARSLDEARICQMLDHENVVRLHRLYQDDRSLYFVMELVCGGELFEEIVSREHYSEQDASDCMRQVFSAICHCHKLRIVHRDLKPENILLSHKPKSQDEPVVVKLADFGLAIKLPDGCNNVSVSICGTPGYIAPETLRHQPIGTPVDLWACGVLLYILLAGYPPFWARQRDDLFEKIKTAEYDFTSFDWDNVSASAKSLVRSMLTICPVARITASEALSHPWICMRRNIAKSLHRQSTLKKLRNFNAWRKLRGAVLSAIALGAATLGASASMSNKYEQHDDTQDELERNIKNVVLERMPIVEDMKVTDPKPKYQETEEFTSSSDTHLGVIEYRNQDSDCSTGSADEGIVAFYQPLSFPQLPDAFPGVQPGHIAHSQTDYDNEDYLDEGSPKKKRKTSDSLDASSSQD